MNATREQRTEQALFRGVTLTIGNLKYCDVVRKLTGILLGADLEPCDLTIKSLGIARKRTSICILTRDRGAIAGLAELAFLLEAHGVHVAFSKNDGEPMQPGDVLLRATGRPESRSAHERNRYGGPSPSGTPTSAQPRDAHRRHRHHRHLRISPNHCARHRTNP